MDVRPLRIDVCGVPQGRNWKMKTIREIESKWFVIYEGDLEVDPLDRGVEDFQYCLGDGPDVCSFKKMMENKGYTCKVYFGELSGMFHNEGKHGEGCNCVICKGEIKG